VPSPCPVLSPHRGPHGQVFVRGVARRGPHGQVFVRGVAYRGPHGQVFVDRMVLYQLWVPQVRRVFVFAPNLGYRRVWRDLPVSSRCAPWLVSTTITPLGWSMTHAYVGSHPVHCRSANTPSRRCSPRPCPLTCALLIRTEPVRMACSFMRSPRSIARSPADRNAPCGRPWAPELPCTLELQWLLAIASQLR
jgi:hypothetical protein